MNGRALSAILLLLVLLAVGLVSTPAFSGEHPWDSDYTGGGDETTAVDKTGDTQVGDTAVIEVATEDMNDGTTEGSAASTPTSSSSLSLSTLVSSFFAVMSVGL